MSTFDAEIFAQAALADARELLDGLQEDSADARVELAELRQDIEATLAALEVECDARRARVLRDDLEKFLPVRKAAILSVVGGRLSVSFLLSLENALMFATKMTVIVAKAFVANRGL